MRSSSPNHFSFPASTLSSSMWAATVSYQSPIFANRANRRALNSLRASLSNYPLGSRIMVRNLPFNTHENRLQKEFCTFGEISEVKLVKDEFTKKSKGYAFIQYTSQDDALLALENMDHKILNGRLIHVEIAKPGKERFGGYPITSGPPKKQGLPEQDEVADCWY